ncbi:MAG: NAD(P)H-dependent oxidoreductase [Clostridia bacterium]|nr:NAD(P)H-dependent oxidoreductase [Clostridia bacterium]
MNILVLNGSPKGKYSITLQTCKYLEIKFPEHRFSYLDVGQKIRSITKDFSEAKALLEEADLLIFSYPVYTFIAPCQLHKFIELMKESGIELAGKWATQITTSKHFYDVTAHKYVEENCFDLGLNYVKGLSADMDDLTKAQGQKDAEEFFRFVLWSIDNKYSEIPPVLPAVTEPVKATVPSEAIGQKKGDIIVVTDAVAEDTNLLRMIERFKAVSKRNVRTLNLNDINIKGGCLGCFNCAVTGECVYKDGFSEILRREIQTSEAIVYAFAVKDHSMGPLFKMYDDRQFCNGHRSVTMGSPVGYLVSGNLSRENNLKMILEGRSEVGGNFLAGIACDERDTDFNIDKMAENLEFAICNNFNKPANFLGVGGMKIFRDLVYQMRGMMRADHKFYKEHNQYDFPQKHKVMSAAMYLVGAMLSSDKIKSKMGNKMNEGMLMPYVKVLNDAEKEMK